MGELIEVREDERFDTDGLSTWLADESDLPDGPPDVLQFGGGKANLTYLLSFPDGAELVLRRPPLGPVATGSHDMAREFRVLSRLWRSFDKAPRAVSFCDDPSIIGSRFFLMERKPGLVIRAQVPEVFGGGEDAVTNSQLSTLVVDTLAEFHAIDPAECGLDDIGHPAGFLDRQIAGWVGRWEKAKHEENLVADEVGEWLRDHVPVSARPTLLHNDWRLDNMAVSESDPSVATAVFDWDMATRGDPLVDVGTLMGSWFGPGEAPPGFGMMPTTAPGWIDRRTAVNRYAEKSGRDMSEINWYLVFGSWKLAVILQQIYIRWLRGQTEDSRFETMGLAAAFLFEHAAERRLQLSE
jgi:aminoglycoside phosphotransferase (APT) family kinase protein